MTALVPSALAKAALAAKRLAERNRSKRNVVFLAGIVLAVLAGGALLAAYPIQLAGPEFLVLLVGLGGSAAGLVLLRFSTRITPTLASCPSCGQSWEIKEGRHVPYSERMPYWDKCPGCALPMRTELLERLARSRSDA